MILSWARKGVYMGRIFLLDGHMYCCLFSPMKSLFIFYSSLYPRSGGFKFLNVE